MEYEKVKRGNCESVVENHIFIKEAKELGFELNRTSYRLMPYLWDCLLNNRFDINKINQEEEEHLNLLMQNNHFYIENDNDVVKCFVSLEYYKFMTKVLFLGYVNKIKEDK